MNNTFRIVPNLYCRGGDVTKDNGFGCYLPEGEVEYMGAESYRLKHSVPGTYLTRTQNNTFTYVQV